MWPVTIISNWVIAFEGLILIQSSCRDHPGQRGLVNSQNGQLCISDIHLGVCIYTYFFSPNCDLLFKGYLRDFLKVIKKYIIKKKVTWNFPTGETALGHLSCFTIFLLFLMICIA